MRVIKNAIGNIIVKRRHLVTNEVNVLRVLQTINRHHQVCPEMVVGNCGWGDDPSKWFIHFNTTDTKWRILRQELEIIRVYGNENIPINTVGKVYSTD